MKNKTWTVCLSAPDNNSYTLVYCVTCQSPFTPHEGALQPSVILSQGSSVLAQPAKDHLNQRKGWWGERPEWRWGIDPSCAHHMYKLWSTSPFGSVPCWHQLTHVHKQKDTASSLRDLLREGMQMLTHCCLRAVVRHLAAVSGTGSNVTCCGNEIWSNYVWMKKWLICSHVDPKKSKFTCWF